MKSIYISLFLLISFFLNAQEDLNRTWFLTTLTIDGNAIDIPNEEGQDGYPTLSILINDAEGQVEGIGICNGFLSDEALAPVSANETIITLNISPSLAICETSDEINFEDSYFNFLGAPESQSFSYSILYGGSVESVELTLTKSNGDQAIYSAINENPPQNLTQEPWYLDYFEIDGIAQSYPAQQDGQLNDYSISYFGTDTYLEQGFLCFYGGVGVYSAYDYFGTSTISIDFLATFAEDCGVGVLNNYDGTFTIQLEGKIHTYEIVEEGQGRRLILTDQNGDRIFYTNAFLNTEEFTQDISIRLFPNPSSEKITITGDFLNAIQSYQIIDISGSIVLTNTFTTTIDIESLSKGLYFIKLQGGETETTLRFIKK